LRASDPRTLVDSASRGDAAAVEELLARYLPGLNSPASPRTAARS
jgi:exoribonuclease II